VGALRRLLQDRIHHLRRRRLDRPRMGGKRLGPAGRHLRRVVEDRFFPDQPDRQQIGQGCVGLALEFGLPQQPARMLRPAAKIDQQPVEHRGRRVLRYAEPLRRAQDGALRRIRRIRRMGAEAAKPGDLGRQVMDGPFAPRGKGAPPRGRRPQGLAAIEMTRRPQAETAGDDGWPVGARCPGGQRGKGGQRLRLRALLCQLLPERRDSRGLQRGWACRERRGEVFFRDAARCDGGGMIGARARQPDSRHAAEQRGRRCKIVTGLPEKGIDGHRRREWKGGRNGAHRCLRRLEEAGNPGRCDLGMLHEHVGLQRCF